MFELKVFIVNIEIFNLIILHIVYFYGWMGRFLTTWSLGYLPAVLHIVMGVDEGPGGWLTLLVFRSPVIEEQSLVLEEGGGGAAPYDPGKNTMAASTLVEATWGLWCSIQCI